MDFRIELRKKEFKKTFDDPRRRREEQQVQIRKRNRDVRLSDKRQQIIKDLPEGSKADEPAVSDIPELARAVLATNHNDQLSATRQFRKLLAIEHNPPIQLVVDAGVVPYFIQFLQDDSRPDLQFEAAWALTNIASGTPEQTTSVVQLGAIPIFVKLLSSPEKDVREQAVWALGNIAGDCVAYRNMVFEAGGLAPLVELMQHGLYNNSASSLLRNAAWTLSNLCRGKPRPQYESIKMAYPILSKLLSFDDAEILTDACWAFSYLSDSGEGEESDAIGVVLNCGISARLVELLSHPKHSVYTPALRSVGNIVSGTEAQTQVMVACGCLNGLSKLISSSNRIIRKETCWTISNIAAGNHTQIGEVIAADLIPVIIERITKDDHDVAKEACWALANAVSGADPEQVKYLMRYKCIPALGVMLTLATEDRLVQVALEAFENILKVGKTIQEQTGSRDNPFVTLIEEAQLNPVFENLQYSTPVQPIAQAVARIMTEYMNYEVDNAAPDQDSMVGQSQY